MRRMNRVRKLLTFGLLTFGLAAVLFAQPSVDRKTLERLVIEIGELRLASPAFDWRPSSPAEPLLREPLGSITAGAVFQSAVVTPVDMVLGAILYLFETAARAKEFYEQPIAFNPAGESAEKPFGNPELLKQELGVGTKEGADEARLIEDPILRNPVLQFLKGPFVGRLRVARISRGSTLDFPADDLIKMAKHQLDILQCFLTTGQRAKLRDGKLACPA